MLIKESDFRILDVTVYEYDIFFIRNTLKSKLSAASYYQSIIISEFVTISKRLIQQIYSLVFLDSPKK